MGVRCACPVLIALLLAMPAQAAPRRVVPHVPGRQAYACAATTFTLSDNTNSQDTQGGGKPGSFDTNGRTYCLDSVTTAHEHAAPGTIGLRTKGRNNTLGPWVATGDDEIWTAQPPGPVLIHGRYACVDSDPATWSQNAASKGEGFCTVVVSAVVKTKTPQPAKPEYECVGTSLTLFDNSNGFAVNNGGGLPHFTTYGRPGVEAYCLNQMRTYHWNDGHGIKPGKLGLRPANLGGVLHRVPARHAQGSNGQNNAPDVNWYVNYKPDPPTIIDGAYFCDDSNPGTWSSNTQSKTDGFCTITATPAFVKNLTLPSGKHITVPTPPSSTPPSAPQPQGQVRCFTGTFSTMLNYPHVISSGGQAMILLQCGVKKADGFQGRMSPSAIFAISQACATFWTYPFASGNPPPPVFVQYTGPSNSGCLNDQHFLPFTVHGPWRVDIQAYDNVRQAPLIPANYVIYVRYPGGDPQVQNTLIVQ